MNNFKTMFQMLKQLNYILDKSQKKRALWLLVVIILGSGFELLGVTAILPFVEAAVSPEKILQNKYMLKIAPVFGITNANTLLLFMGLALIIVYVVKNVFMLYVNFVQYDFSTGVQKELSVKMLHSYMTRPYTFFLNSNTAEVLRGCSSDIASIYNVIDYLSVILAQILMVLMIGIYLIYTDPIIAVSVLALMMIVLSSMVLFFKPTIKKAGIKNQQLQQTKNQILVQIVNGIKEIFVMQRREIFLKAYDDASEQNRKVQRTYGVLSTSPDRIVEGICVSGIIGIVCIRLVNDSTSMIEFIPKLAAFAMAAFKLLPSIGKIANRMTGIIYSRPGVISVYNNMVEANRYEEQMKQYVSGRSTDAELSEDLTFHNRLFINHVSWQYENQKRPVLTDVQLAIHKGEAVAFIGSSGAGKTTLSDIVLGLLQPNKGTVEMDGIDVYTIPMQWAHIVGYVPQSIFLMDDTVRNNIAFGLPADMIDDKYIWDALEKAQLKDFIQNLPGGLDTIVGERGVKFSGGQRQRIAIARALYNKPQILILDEATAALDNETETAVMESIDALQGHITMIIVAHRLTTIRNCDKIYEIKDGIAVERNKMEVLA